MTTDSHSQSGSKSPRRYRDKWRTTLRKVPYGKFATDAALELATSGVGYLVARLSSPGVGLLADKTVEYMLLYILHRFTRVYESGECNLGEIFGGTIPEKRYSGVADFWANVNRDGWDKLDKDEHPLIEVFGLLSPYGPLTPAHPMSRPGYTVEGWDVMGDLKVANTEEYDTQDSFIYGDRVIRLSQPRQGKYYAGLYDAYYGSSELSLPLYVDAQTVVRAPKSKLSDLWAYPMTAGKIVKLKGRLIQTANFYNQFKNLPEEYRTLPTFGLEVFEVNALEIPGAVTHISASVGWETPAGERVIAQYFDMQNKRQFNAAEQRLDETREKHKKSLLFNYDDLACLSPEWRYKLPGYNEMLRSWFDGEKFEESAT